MASSSAFLSLATSAEASRTDSHAAGAYIALQSVYFIGTNDRGLVTMFRGVPYKLPGDLALYSSDYVSGVGASTLTVQRRRTLLDHSLRSEANAATLVRSLELGQLE